MARGNNAYPSYNPEGAGTFIVNCTYFMNELTNTINVLDAKTEGDHHEYKIVGSDPFTNTSFTVMRRFRHFYILRASFILKFPALYVPPLPQKQAVNNMTDSTI